MVNIIKITLMNFQRMRFKTLFNLLVIAIGISAYCLVFNMSGLIKNTIKTSFTDSQEMKKITAYTYSSRTGINRKLNLYTIERINNIENVEKVVPEIHTGAFLFDGDINLGRIELSNYPLSTEKIATGEDFRNRNEDNIMILPDLLLDLGEKSVQSKSLVGRTLTLKVQIENEKNAVIDEKCFDVIVGGVYSAKGEFEANPAFVREEYLYSILAVEHRVNDVNFFKKMYSPDKMSIYVDDKENVNKVASIIEAIGFNTNYIEKSLRDFSKKISGFLAVGKIISYVVIFLGLLLLVNTLAYNIKARQKEIGVMKAIGYSNTNIGLMVFIESFLLIYFGLALSIILQIFIYNLLNVYIEQWSLQGKLSINYTNVIHLLIISFILPVVSAVIPAKKCYSIDPIFVLKGE